MTKKVEPWSRNRINGDKFKASLSAMTHDERWRFFIGVLRRIQENRWKEYRDGQR